MSHKHNGYCFIGTTAYSTKSGLMTASRLKALGVESVVLDRNPQIGDSWANRYDCLNFHVPTSNCEMPYACKKTFHSHSLIKHS